MSAVLESTRAATTPDDVVDAVMRPFRRPSKRFWLAIALLTVVVAVGFVAWIYQLQQGMWVAGYTDSSFWSIYISDVVAFIGVSYGGAVVSAILLLTGASWRAPLVRMSEGAALVTVIVGAIFVIPHLGRPDRLLNMLTHANVASPVFWDMMAIITYTFATLVFFVLPLIPDTAILLETHPDELGRGRRLLYRFISRGWVGSAHQRRVLHSAVTIVAIVIIPLAVSVHSVLAWAFALVSRPGWHESIWAPYFVIAALYSGVALVILVVAGFRRGYHLEAFINKQHFVRLAYIMVALGAVYVYLTLADLLPSAYVGESDPTAIIYGMLQGTVAGWFWFFLVVGTLLPIVLVALPWTRNIPGVVIASVLVVIGMWIKRVIMISETSAYNTLSKSFVELFHFTWVSAAVTIAGVAAIPLMLMLLFRVVPLLALAHVQEEIQAQEDPAPEHSPTAGASHGRAVGTVGAVLLLMVTLGAIGVTQAQPVYAAAPGGAVTTADVTDATVEVTAVQQGLEITVTAKVASAGLPVEGALVNFYESTPMFAPGDNQVPLGAVQTDTTGTAAVTYVAATTGPRTITATYLPTILGDPVAGTTDLDVTDAAATYSAPAPGPLEGAGRALTTGTFGLVIVVFVILIVQVVRVRRACRPSAEVPAERALTT